VQRCDSFPGLDLIQAEGEGEAAGQLLDAADVRRCPVQVGALILQQLVEQLQENRQLVVSARGRTLATRRLKSTFSVSPAVD